MPLVKTLIHVYTQIFFVGTGNSIGRELAPREAGAALAQKWRTTSTTISSSAWTPKTGG